ncbi:hypothetical protein TrVE_jg3098 [Triparma verrucosa]|uniref:Calcineurin-like phosphoesterase domain-containing protein n=1 Tax=Triparma verrucosa TaxID=1606542 RepID=A0A9W7B0U6_9STRA|nr:hypothetical protein TrVE_jg3098 [Triparma verrucosa]
MSAFDDSTSLGEEDISSTFEEQLYAQRLLPPDLESNPDLRWRDICKTETFLPAKYLISPGEGRTRGKVRFVAISDTHGLHDKPVSSVKASLLPEGDVLLHAGDFTNVGSAKDLANFAAFTRACEEHFSEVIVIAGNHDISLDPAFYKRNKERFHHCKQQQQEQEQQQEQQQQQQPEHFINSLGPNTVYLEDSSHITKLGNFKCFGSPWQPEFGGWAFNLNRGDSCRAKWDLIPHDTDILLTHGPPLGRGDLYLPHNNRAGCVDLLNVVKTIKPKVHVFGHIHEGAGCSSDGVTDYINASTCTFSYRPTNAPVVFDLVPSMNEDEDKE